MQKFYAGALALALSVTPVWSGEIRFDGFPDLNSHLDVQIPKFTEGRAALLARAVSGGEEVELRRVITQK